MERRVFHDSDSSTPQGWRGDPLLANIALHGMEGRGWCEIHHPLTTCVGKRCLIRYADDFVVFCDSEEDAYQAPGGTIRLAGSAGTLSLRREDAISASIRWVHFLGRNIRQYQGPETRWGWKLLIKAFPEIGRNR